MTFQQMKMPDKSATENEPPPSSQRKRPEEGRYLLQVDRQTKGYYQSLPDAEKAGMAIKQKYSALQVSVYDRVKSVNTLLPTPAPLS